MKKFLIMFLFVFLYGAISASAVELPILMYHSVDDENGPYSVSPAKLESDIQGLLDEGYTTVSIAEVIDFVYSDGVLPEKPVMLTFDDGYENNCTTLLPIAERLGVKFEVFAVAGFINYNSFAMNWDEVKMVNESPYGNIECHTYNLHSFEDMTRRGVVRKEGEPFREWEHIFRDDLSDAKNFFMDNMGDTTVAFAYPFGNFTSETDRILRESGYKMTVTTEAGVNEINKGDYESLYLMMRISMDGKAISALDEIKGFSDIHTNEKTQLAKMGIWKEMNVSRLYAITTLYGQRLANDDFNLEYIESYKDLKHEDPIIRALFAKCVHKCIISGFSDWTMRPNHYITRGEFAVLLARCTDYDGREAVHKFADSAEWNDWALSWCYEKGYMLGYGESFGVNDFLTKEQIDTVAQRAGLVK